MTVHSHRASVTHSERVRVSAVRSSFGVTNQVTEIRSLEMRSKQEAIRVFAR